MGKTGYFFTVALVNNERLLRQYISTRIKVVLKSL